MSNPLTAPEQPLPPIARVSDVERRVRREANKAIEKDRRDMLRDFLVVLDDLDRAMQASESSTDSSIGAGVELVRRQFLATLARYDVQPIDALGEAFDPMLHDAVASVPAAHPDDGLVVQVVRPGYRVGQQTLRPAQVVVGRSLHH